VVSKLSSLEELFAGRHFDREVIILCVRWYLRYKLSFRDLVEMMAERGLNLAHTTILRWVSRYAPEFVKRWNRFARSAGRSWRVDETYIKVRGRWTYLYRAVDKAGQTIDFRLSRTRDGAAAKAFFKKAIRHEGRSPHTITLDGYAASHRAVREMRADGLLAKRTVVRSSKYLNNLIEQDHRGVKSRTRPMLGFKNFKSAAITIAGVELLRRIHKDQFALNRLRLEGQPAPAIWNAVLAA
jgi:transposase-like protein